MNLCRIVTALKRTIDIQEEIDALYPKVESVTHRDITHYVST